MILTREAILSANDLKIEDVPVPEWGGDVRVRALTGEERDALGRAMLGSDGKVDPDKNYRLLMVTFTAIGEDGKPLFTADDVTALAQRNGAALTRVFKAAERLNALQPTAIEQARGN